jgi:ABC-type transporter Mla subunit MlaD
MADNNRQPGSDIETKVDTLEPRQVEKQPDVKEVQEAKTEVGMEAGEIIEGAEVSSGEITESEKKKKEGDSGGAAAGKASGQAAQIKKQTYPSVKKMTSQVESELKKEIKNLQKKVKSVMKSSGNLNAVELNTLMARLRQLKDALASLAYAAADIVRDMWNKYVKG